MLVDSLYIVLIIVLLGVTLFLSIPYFITPTAPKRLKKGRYDCILVLGYPINRDGTIHYLLENRVLKAFELFNNKKGSYILCSGGAVANMYNEAMTMSKYLEKLGVSESRIITENNAKNTFENLENSFFIMRQLNLKSVIIVTSSWHIRRTNSFIPAIDLEYVFQSSTSIKFKNIYSTIIAYWIESYLIIKNQLKPLYPSMNLDDE